MVKNYLNVNTDFDFGIDFADDMTEAVIKHETNANQAQAKAETMYKMIMPLLNNLKKNPEKPNIVWPDREKKIDEFIKKLEDVLHS